MASGPVLLLLAACWTEPVPPEPEPVPEPAPALAPEPVPPAPPEPVRIVEIVLGDTTTCGRFSDLRVRCHGRLSLPATALDGQLVVTDLEVCGRAAGTVRCLRDGVDRSGPTPFVEVTSGAGARIGRAEDGSVWAFVGNTEEGVELFPVPLPAPARAVVADGWRGVALLDDGRLVGWDPYAAMTGSPQVRDAAVGVLGADASYLMTCWFDEGAVWCRGEGAPRKIRGVQEPTAIAVGRRHACAIDGGRVVCWGDGALGQLGPGRKPSSAAKPIAVPDGAPLSAIDAGSDHTCVLRTDGTAFCWGRDNEGQVSSAWE